MGICSNLDALMNQTGTSSYKLAKAIGVHVSSVTNWRSGKCLPQIEHIQKISKYFNVPVDELIQQKSKMNGDT